MASESGRPGKWALVTLGLDSHHAGVAGKVSQVVGAAEEATQPRGCV